MTLASQKQKAMFFALANQLGYDPEAVKERAKARYGLESFTQITTEQLSWLIDRLQEQQEKKSVAPTATEGGE